MILGSGLIQAAGWTPEWLIRDEFTDTVAAGSVDGTAATPGPGTRAVVDGDNRINVDSGVLAIATGATVSTTLGYAATSYAAGLCVVGKISVITEAIQFGWGSSDSGTERLVAAIQTTSGQWRVRSNAGSVSSLGSYSTSTPYFLAIVTDGSHIAYFVNGGGGWSLIWAYSQTFVSAYAGIATAATAGAANTDYIRVLQLPAPFDTDDGLATDTHSGSVASGTTFSHEADLLLEVTVTTLTTTNMSFSFRQSSDTNRWFAYIVSNGDFYLFEVVNGTSTQRAYAAGAIASGHRVVIVAEGNTIKGYSNNVLRWTYASATSHATATAGKILSVGNGGVFSDLKSWPRTLTGEAAAILNKVSA